MKKIALIAYREFLQRVRNKLFLLTTLFLPIAIACFYIAMFYFSSKDTETYRVGVMDPHNFFENSLQSDAKFEFIQLVDTSVMTSINSLYLDAVLYGNDTLNSSLHDSIKIISKEKIGLISKNEMIQKIQKIIEYKRYIKHHIDYKELIHDQEPIHVKFENLDGIKENELKENIAYGVGYVLGFMMYIVLTIYGSQVMRGVMEEKTSRIAEIIISSVKPFELLLGKIIGIGLVSLMQFVIWGVFIFLLNVLFGWLIGGQLNDVSHLANQAKMVSTISENKDMIVMINSLKSYNFVPILFGFIFYFIGGYFLYSSLFAAVGSAVNDDPQDAQSLMLPIMMPIFASFILLTKSINNPNSMAAVVGSIVPFTSPVVMMSRLVFGIPEGVPVWQLVVSIVVLIVTTLFFITMAARIYRVGILLYGKKSTWKEMIQWIFLK